ncbi:MAG: hypothetical protein ACOZQL_21350 [Myxococcota bacterium]
MRGALVTLALLAGTAAAQTVALGLEPARPVKGRDVSARLEIVIGGVELAAPPVLRANVGTIDSLERVGPGRFTARYVLPTTRFPEVAIIVAFSPWPHPQSVEGAFGVLRVPIASAVEVPGRAEPGAEVTLTLDKTTFGPVTAAADGTFRLPVVVPPGFGVAKTSTRDRVGNKRAAQLDLMLPPTDQLACVVTPTRLPADGASKARVLCASSDRFGQATRGARVAWRGGRGVFSAPRELGDGVQEWTWTAPRELGAGVEKMLATWKQGAVDSSEELTVELSQGPVQRLQLEAPTDPVHLGSVWRARARVMDALGRPLAGVLVNGGTSSVASDASGEVELSWQPRGSPGAQRVAFTASGPLGREPARLQAWRADGRAVALVTDLAGLPVPGQSLVAGALRLVTDATGKVEFVAPVGVSTIHHADWPGLSATIGETAPPVVATSVLVQVAPPAPVNVRVALESGGFSWWVEAADGSVLDGRAVEVRTGERTQRRTSRGRTREESSGLVSVSDVESRVSAVVEVPR